jgi:hypothetical protein
VDGYNNKTDIEYPFEHSEVIHYTLDGVSIHPVLTKIHVSFLTQLQRRKETAQGFQHFTITMNGIFQTVAEFKEKRRKLRMDQQHSSYSTILT